MCITIFLEIPNFMIQKITLFKLICSLLLIGPGLALGALDNPDIIGGESGYWIDINPDLWPVLVVIVILLGIIYLMPRE